MPPTVAELIDALPEELREDRAEKSPLHDVLERLALRPVPVGRHFVHLPGQAQHAEVFLLGLQEIDLAPSAAHQQ